MSEIGAVTSDLIALRRTVSCTPSGALSVTDVSDSDAMIPMIVRPVLRLDLHELEAGGDLVRRNNNVEQQSFRGLVADAGEIGADLHALAVVGVTRHADAFEDGVTVVRVGREGEDSLVLLEDFLTVATGDRGEHFLRTLALLGVFLAEDALRFAGVERGGGRRRRIPSRPAAR